MRLLQPVAFLVLVSSPDSVLIIVDTSFCLTLKASSPFFKDK